MFTMVELRNTFGEDKKIEIVKSFAIPYVGWEMDNDAAIVLVNGKTNLITTNHGRLVVNDWKALEVLTKKTNQMVDDMKIALDMRNWK